jgi:replicative DNA helicase
MSKGYPTASAEMERHTVGAAFISHEAAEVIATTPEGFFWDAQISAIAKAISSVYASGGTVDHVSVTEALRGLKTPQAQVASQEILSIAVEVVTDASFPSHFAVCQGMYRRRMALKGLAQAAELIRDEALPIEDAVNKAEGAVFAAMDAGGGGSGTDRVLMPREYIKIAMDEFAASAKGNPYGVATGVPAWDAILGCLKPGTLNTLGARPGVGKSMLALQAAKTCGKWTLFFSLEMLAIEQVERMISSRMEGVDQQSLRSPNFWKLKGDEVIRICKEIQDSKIMISDNSSHSIESIARACRRKKKDGILDLVILDYLQLVKYETKRGMNESQAIGQVSKSLKQLANELRIPFLNIASLSRENEKREEKRHMKSDLRGSGELESDSHSITFLYQHSEYDKKMPQEFKKVIELDVKKNRGGETGTRFMRLDGARSHFTELTYEDKRNYLDYVNGGSNRQTPSQSKGFMDD